VALNHQTAKPVFHPNTRNTAEKISVFSNAVNANFARVLSAQEQHAIACNEIAAERKQMAYRAYRLGLDVGTNSIGWFIVWLNAESEAYALGPRRGAHLSRWARSAIGD